ncbi:MAG: radical SAM protein [Selenomonadaceae bacterium]|nr:radical SAM protein [Selenomonadaceae bacterium]
MNPLIKKILVKSIISKSNLPVCDYSVNPYVGCTHSCKYCYACFMKKFSNHLEEWGTFLDVKIWEKIKNPQKYSGKSFFMSSVTDPYNPQEEIFQRTKTFLEEIQGVDINLSLQTKSDLILRDLDLIKNFKNIRVGFSINTLDENFKNDMDNAVSISRRIVAMKKLHEEKISTTCFISPIFPEITDVEKIIDAVKNFCNLIWLENLNLRGDYKPKILNYIKNNFPRHEKLYQEIYQRKNISYWIELDKKIKNYAEKNNLEYVYNRDDLQKNYSSPPTIVNFFFHEKIKKSAGGKY